MTPTARQALVERLEQAKLNCSKELAWARFSEARTLAQMQESLIQLISDVLALLRADEAEPRCEDRICQCGHTMSVHCKSSERLCLECDCDLFVLREEMPPTLAPSRPTGGAEMYWTQCGECYAMWTERESHAPGCSRERKEKPDA